VAETSRNHKAYLENLPSTITPREWADQ
jgi:chorismate synthase